MYNLSGEEIFKSYLQIRVVFDYNITKLRDKEYDEILLIHKNQWN